MWIGHRNRATWHREGYAKDCVFVNKNLTLERLLTDSHTTNLSAQWNLEKIGYKLNS